MDENAAIRDGREEADLQAKVLIVDDEEDERYLLKQILLNHGYEVIEADCGRVGLELAETGRPDVIMLDVEMPDLDGFELCRRLKVNPATSDIPVVFVTGRRLEEESRVEGLSIGGNDFIVKPYSAAELAARVSVMVRIKRAEDALRKRSATDDLTGLYNRRFLFDRFEEEFSRARRHHSPIACVVADLDHFKEVNDQYGHLAGDAVLRQVAAVLRNHARREDLVGRYGGEEFLVVLPETPVAGAFTVADRIRRGMAENPCRAEGHSLTITISLGVAAYPEHPAENPDDLVRLADDALYQAKSAGRNRVVVYEGGKTSL